MVCVVLVILYNIVVNTIDIIVTIVIMNIIFSGFIQ